MRKEKKGWRKETKEDVANGEKGSRTRGLIKKEVLWERKRKRRNIRKTKKRGCKSGR